MCLSSHFFLFAITSSFLPKCAKQEVNIRKLTEDDRAQFEAAMPSKYVHQLAFHWREFFDSSREMDACLEKESS